MLGKNDQDALHFWLKGDYSLNSVVEAVRKLERPSAGAGQHRSAFYADGGGEQEGWEVEDEYNADWAEYEQAETYWMGDDWQEETWNYDYEEGADQLEGFPGLNDEQALDESTVQT
eukprot:3840535-Amphidinium_carterae.1